MKNSKVYSHNNYDKELTERMKADLINEAGVTIIDPKGVRTLETDTSIEQLKKELGEENFTLFLKEIWDGLRTYWGRVWTDKKIEQLEKREKEIEVDLKTPDGCHSKVKRKPQKQSEKKATQ